MTEQLTQQEYRDFNPKHEFTSQLLDLQDDRVQSALALEQKVWNEKKYGSLEEYNKYFDQSRIFVAFKGQDCIGISRVFKAHPLLPPFMNNRSISDPVVRESLLQGCAVGVVEELGTVAVDDERAPYTAVAKDLWRLAYRNARGNGVETWGIIMEPDRVDIMNKWYGFTFKQIGPEFYYQGGMCAVHITGLQIMIESMEITHPERYAFFVTDPLRKA